MEDNLEFKGIELKDIGNDKDSVLQAVKGLRKQIDESKPNQMSENFLTKCLSLYYQNLPDQGGLTFDIDDLSNYMNDYINRNIEAALTFIELALKKNSQIVEETIKKIIKPENQASGDQYEKLLSIISKFIVSKKTEEIKSYYSGNKTNDLTISYLGLEDDINKIVYNAKNGPKYVYDWLKGTLTAEIYVVRFMRENPNEFNANLDRLIENSGFEKVYELALERVKASLSEDLFKFISYFTYRKELFECEDPKRTANMLDQAHTENFLESILGGKDWSKSFLNRQTLTNPLSYIKNSQVIVKIHSRLNGPAQKILEHRMFEYALVPETQLEGGPIRYIAALEQIQTQNIASNTKPMILKQMFSIIIDEDIKLAYYIASLKQDHEMMLAICTKNPSMFRGLFEAEMKVMMEEKLVTMLDERIVFYTELMAKPKMIAYQYYDECLNALNELFTLRDLEILVSQKQKISTPNREKLQYVEEIDSAKDFFDLSNSNSTSSNSSQGGNFLDGYNLRNQSSNSIGLYRYLANFSPVFTSSSSNNNSNQGTNTIVDDEDEEFCLKRKER